MDQSELARLLAPEAWVARTEDQRTFGALWEVHRRQMESLNYAGNLLAAGYAVVKMPAEGSAVSDPPAPLSEVRGDGCVRGRAR